MFPVKAKRCIFLFMTGGPSQIDLFDPKPLLNKLDGQPLPPSFGKIHSQFLESDPLCMGSHRQWGKYGQSGLDMSDLVPNLHRHADDIALVRSCVADSVIHAPAMYQMTTGRILMGHPSLGSWVVYGLGSESENLPAYVVMTQPEGTPEGGAPCWGAGYLPAHYQGTLFRSGPAPIVNLRPPEDLSLPRQRRVIDLVRSMNEQDLDPADTELSARISTYELAFRMQSAAPEAVDLASESERTRTMYGLDDPRTVEFGTRCLLARRLVERGVRFVQLYSGGGPVAMQWDAHDDIDANHEKMCGLTDKPVAALLTDLKRTGLLEETLVIWGGEFGRTPGAPARGPGPRPQRHRLHHVDGRRRSQGRNDRGSDRRDRPEGDLRPRPHQRHSRDDPAPDGPGSHPADVPAQRPRRAVDRRRGPRADGAFWPEPEICASTGQITSARRRSRRGPCPGP